MDPLLWNSVTFQESVSKTSSDSGLLSKRPEYTADSLLFWNLKPAAKALACYHKILDVPEAKK